jgi:hypothetical protein
MSMRPAGYPGRYSEAVARENLYDEYPSQRLSQGFASTETVHDWGDGDDGDGLE